MELETLKSGFGWSDEELYDAFCYNLKTRLHSDDIQVSPYVNESHRAAKNIHDISN